MDTQRKKYKIKKKKKQINYLPALIALVLILCVSIGVVVLAVSHSKKNKSDIASSDNASGNIEMTTVPETTTSEPEVEINVCMIGDMLIHEGVYKTGLESDGSYNFDHLFANILPDLAASDMNIVNQETILGGTEMGLGGYPAFNSPQEIGDAEVKAGFNIISMQQTTHSTVVFQASTILLNSGKPNIRIQHISESTTVKKMPKIFMYTKNMALRLLFLTIHTELTELQFLHQHLTVLTHLMMRQK